MVYAPPAGAPPTPTTRPTPQRQDSIEAAIPDEAPPAYDAISHDPTVQAGPNRMDFSGPPPLPDRFQHLTQTPTGGQSIPGVGVGYGPTNGMHYQNTGQGSWRPPPPPQHPQQTGYGSPSGPPPPPRLPASPSTQSQDLTPTETPVPGRPLLHGGQLLVYPKGHWCSKCSNTGYKNFDPSHPCSQDWRKYGKPFNSALAHSYSITPKVGHNASTTAATNFQRPLPGHRPAGGQQLQQHGHHQSQQYGHHQPHPQQQWRPPPPPIRPVYGYPQNGALVVQPGDPRIGGHICNRCGGSGREYGLFFFDDGPCMRCNGLGRVF